MNLIIQIAVSLTTALILGELFYRKGYPRVIGQILAGVFLSLPIFGFLFLPEVRESFGILADLGIIFLLLLAGMETNLHKLRQTRKDIFLISLFAALIPFMLGFVAIVLLAKTGIFLIPNVYTVALVVGACLSITAEGTTLNLLMELKALKTKVGTILVGAGIVDDIFEVIFLSLLVMYVHKSMQSLALFPLMIVTFIFLVFIIIKIVPIVISIVQKERSRIATVSTMIVIALIIAGLSQLFGLGTIIGAFIAGLIIQLSNKNRYDEHEDVKELNTIAFSLIVPFFFINIGMHFDWRSMFVDPMLFLIVLAVAIAGKLFGAMLATPWTDLSLQQTTLIGWGMNSRGAVELVMAELARANNLIPVEVYSAIVAMTVITTMIFPFVLKYMLRKHPKIMN
ncbi:MAG: cation:proton antiporter [Candidatus Woesearchaeota archaeon]